MFDFGNPDTVPVVHTSKPKLTRISRACERCRTLKAKCNGAETCDRCSEQDKTCTYTPSGRTTKEKRRKLKVGVDISIVVMLIKIRIWKAL